ncbi:MAG: hypothetical protein IJA68_02510 [Clostridia bacterium]|nr:hypothetical protein [Clostridia bacterium]
MKKGRMGIMVLALALLLCSCAQGSPDGTSGSTTTTQLPVTTTTLWTETVVPWEMPQQEELSYDEFFSVVRPYERFSHRGTSFGGEEEKDYYVTGTDDLGWHIVRSETNEIMWKIVGCEDVMEFVGDESHLYGITESGQLIETDHFGNERTVLCEDTTGVLGERNFQLNGATLFFVTETKVKEGKDGYAINRVYLPEKRVDTLIRTDEKPYLYPPISNVEIEWDTRNEQFYVLYEQLRKNPPKDKNYDFDDEGTIGAIALDYQIHTNTVHYYNDLTDTYKSLDYHMYSYPRNPGSHEVHGYRWWLIE